MRCLQDYYDFYHLQFIIKQFEFYVFDGRYKCRTGTSLDHHWNSIGIALWVSYNHM